MIFGLFGVVLALVCSIFGSALEDTGEGRRPTDSIFQLQKNQYNSIYHDTGSYYDKLLEMKNPRTNTKSLDNRIFNYENIDNNNYKDNNKLNNIIEEKDLDSIYYNYDNKNRKIITANDNKQMYNLKLHKAYFDNKFRTKPNNLNNKILQTKNTKLAKSTSFKEKKREGDFRRRVKRQDVREECEPFIFNTNRPFQISHPHFPNSKSTLYTNSTDCVTTINGTEGNIVELTFVDMFHIESHPECAYDYLEIRDGIYGFSPPLGKLCGDAFPPQIKSTGPSIWMKFHSDETIEYEGFHINVALVPNPNSHSIPESCYTVLTGTNGVVDSSTISSDCNQKSLQTLDVLWRIETRENTRIHLNFTQYQLAKPNECEDNGVQVFGSVLEYEAKLAHYCGSMANSVTSKGGEGGKPDQGNVMYIRLYASKSARTSAFSATFTEFRTMDPNKADGCRSEEFDCEDNTCIDISLMCNGYANCRLKADEDPERCKAETQSMITQPHIMVILIIFSLIISGMSFVFLFKCFRKLYQDHKLIKEHIKQSCEDRLDMIGSRLLLDADRLRRDSEPRASLERENHANEMFKKNRSFSQHQTSIDSEVRETEIDLEVESWRRDVEHTILEEEEHRLEKNGRQRHSDTSRREEILRRDSRKKKEKNNVEKESIKEKKEIRDASVAAPDTKESSCQTRESLFQAGAPSSEGTGSGSGSGSRGFSTFGYSGATIVRPSPPAQHTATSEITIELLRSVPPQPSLSKKLTDRRPMSAETTRSAPDVIIVSKPIR